MISRKICNENPATWYLTFTELSTTCQALCIRYLEYFFQTVIWGRLYYYFNFTAEKTETQAVYVTWSHKTLSKTHIQKPILLNHMQYIILLLTVVRCMYKFT